MARVQLFRGPLQQMLRGRSGPVVRYQAKVAGEIARAARPLVPVGKGPGPHLRDEIRTSVQPGAGGFKAVVTADADYAVYVHKKKPFLIQAARSLGLRVRDIR